MRKGRGETKAEAMMIGCGIMVMNCFYTGGFGGRENGINVLAVCGGWVSKMKFLWLAGAYSECM